MRNFREVIEIWPDRAAFARAIGVHYQTARKMFDRCNIRHEYWSDVIAGAHARGIRLTADDLLNMSRVKGRARRRAGRRPGVPRASA